MSVSSITEYLNSTYDSTRQDEPASGELDEDAFLQLLLAQLQWQDPMSPMDNTEMVAQLAQFTSLSSLEELNSQMDDTLSLLSNQLYMSATGYVGKEIEAYGSSVSKKGDVISTVTYTLAGDAASVTAHILDSDGEVVNSVELGQVKEGSHSFTWKGKDTDDSEADDGTYSIAFVANDANDGPVSVSAKVSGLVSSVYVENGTTYLETTDGRIVAAANVSKVVDTELIAGNTDDDSDNSDDSEDSDEE